MKSKQRIAKRIALLSILVACVFLCLRLSPTIPEPGFIPAPESLDSGNHGFISVPLTRSATQGSEDGALNPSSENFPEKLTAKFVIPLWSGMFDSEGDLAVGSRIQLYDIETKKPYSIVVTVIDESGGSIVGTHEFALEEGRWIPISATPFAGPEYGAEHGPEIDFSKLIAGDAEEKRRLFNSPREAPRADGKLAPLIGLSRFPQVTNAEAISIAEESTGQSGMRSDGNLYAIESGVNIAPYHLIRHSTGNVIVDAMSGQIVTWEAE